MSSIKATLKTLRRAYTRDVAYLYRCPGGFPGEVNRTHPVSIVPGLQHATNPVKGYGRAVLYDATNGRPRNVVAGDTAVTKIAGVAVRPFPTSQGSALDVGASAAFGSGTPPATGVIDVMESGFIMSPIVGTPVNGGAVFVWIAADSGSNVQGGFCTTATAGSTIAITNARFRGGVDSAGVGEIQVWNA